MNPEVSIIVPVYNVEEYLPKCIDSILAQTFTNFELLLVNDGSIDGSGEICNEYALKDKRINVIHKKNGGLSSARNMGLKNSKGNYIGFVDSDDYIDKDMYGTLHGLCIKRKADIAICNFLKEINGIIVNNKRSRKIIIELSNEEGMIELFKGVLYRFSTCNKLFNRKCFQGVTFPEGRIHEDLSTTYKLFANSSKSVYSTYEGYIYVKRNNSILTKRYNERRLQAFIGWDEIFEFINRRYESINEQVVATFVYWCIDNIIYIVNQVEDRKLLIEYVTFIQNYTRKYKGVIDSNKMLSKKYKLRIKLLNLSYRTVLIEKRINRKLS